MPMIHLPIIENCCDTYPIIEFIDKQRGVGATLAYTVIINGEVKTFEMNDEGEWSSEDASKDLCQCIDKVLSSIKI